MEYEIGITVYGYIVVNASSRNDAAKVYDYSFERILQEMKVSSIAVGGRVRKRKSGKEVKKNVKQD